MHFLSVSLVNRKVYKKRGISSFTNYNFLLSDIHYTYAANTAIHRCKPAY